MDGILRCDCLLWESENKNFSFLQLSKFKVCPFCGRNLFPDMISVRLPLISATANIYHNGTIQIHRASGQDTQCHVSDKALTLEEEAMRAFAMALYWKIADPTYIAEEG